MQTTAAIGQARRRLGSEPLTVLSACVSAGHERQNNDVVRIGAPATDASASLSQLPWLRTSAMRDDGDRAARVMNGSLGDWAQVR